MSKPTLDDLRAFMAVAEHRSFRRAADLLGVTRSTLSHAMRGLEDNLGTRLLHRTTRSVSLTEAGESLLRRIGPLVGDLDTALEEVAGAQGSPRGTLRINGSEGAIRLLLQTVVPEFLARYPGIELDLVAEGRLVDIVEQGFDAGVRLGEAVPRDMVAIRLGPDMRFLAVASPGYLLSHPAPTMPDALLQHQCIRQRLPSGKRYRWEFLKRGQDMAIDVPGALTLDNTQLIVEAAIDGLGIAYVPEPYARAALSDGRLVAVLEDWCPLIPGLFLYFPGTRHMPTSLRAFIDMVRAAA
ncbi:LysR family transcriptional regulator [bacterium M00.F.Ca.ET.228.01.1.1]|uniref:LysR family transcriptional regulator n=1 Tax=Paraburkholderia phenoliruptrix TaxID=252970 RepID=UPI0010919CB3|nr:LysR family transcriptional regulator [Paraburkholderia phenoliruptrix]TGP40091.1 LysR family transcriptional regulator [bacterium M00.F.Ca.ET.228.01.1.1]TGR96066.1 LysR family transcriptional regulator [bacterium M00.F.Ca.ET.191.01.1.1]TGT97203.1 LysR family transcriptional regulator [bacterium M00.F.Ca.ET.155.01.1.1]MBW0448459.1 LysR family transcriptional regulator [Paraburkholderia phenoliruptrix]MBW9100679.1 LysR family transcriptional regulator [Paraburkholderia phenoliruptrix]